MLRARLAGGVPSAPASSPSPTLAPASHGFPRTTILLTAVRLPSSTPRVTLRRAWVSLNPAHQTAATRNSWECVWPLPPRVTTHRSGRHISGARSVRHPRPLHPRPSTRPSHSGGSRHARGSSTSLLLGARPSSRWSRIGVSTVRAPGHASTDSARRRSSRTTPHPLAQAAKRSGQDCGPGDQRGFASASAGD